MLTRFNLYDIFGIFIPGAVFIAVAYGLTTFLDLLPSKSPGLLSSLLFIPAAYAVGFLVHQAARWIWHHVWSSPTHSVDFIVNDRNGPFQSDFIEILKSLIKENFELDIEAAQDKTAATQQAFDLCYYDVIQEGDGVYVENFNAQYGMCRSLALVIWLSALAIAIGFFFDCYSKSTNLFPWWGYLLAIITCLLSGSIFLHGVEKMGKSFAKAVYLSFFVSKANEGESYRLNTNHELIEQLSTEE